MSARHLGSPHFVPRKGSCTPPSTLETIGLDLKRVAKSPRLAAAGNRRLKASARDLAQVLEQSGEAVIVKDLNGVITYWNREAASLYGFSAQEAIGQSLRKLHA